MRRFVVRVRLLVIITYTRVDGWRYCLLRYCLSISWLWLGVSRYCYIHYLGIREDEGYVTPIRRAVSLCLYWTGLFAYVHSSTGPPARAYHMVRKDLLRLRSCNETTDLPNPDM
jgi:hypothetical protein